jgi:NAD(P)H-dependent flavin oxidoreductase YrpB (nitropropane dioxygenase family)
MAAALAAGADGVRVGTRFAASVESDIHPIYAEALINARAEDSIYTRTFHVGWPKRRIVRCALPSKQPTGRQRW